jgi:hypothetical protein
MSTAVLVTTSVEPVGELTAAALGLLQQLLLLFCVFCFS